jgi:NADH dehydrogenase
LNARVASVDAQGVVLQSGDRINGATVVSTVGTRPHDFISCLPCTDERGRVPTQPSLQVQDYSNVWALGDCASVPNAASGKPSPTTAQFAVRQARALADNLVATIDGRPTRSFSYRARGQLAAIGHRKAVAEVFGFKLSGLFAWLLWRAYYLTHIPTFARKVRLFLEWNWSMLFAKDITLLGLERSSGNKSE